MMANQNTSTTTPAQKRAARSNAGGRAKSTRTTSRARSTSGSGGGGLEQFTPQQGYTPQFWTLLNNLVAFHMTENMGQQGGAQTTLEASTSAPAQTRTRRTKAA
jgi:hypothetical protein